MEIDTPLYQTIIDSLHDGLYLVDLDNTVQYWNKAAERLSGFTQAEVLGRQALDNILTGIDLDGGHRGQDSEPLTATMRDGIPRESEIYLRRKDGNRIPISRRISPLTNAEGAIIGGVELFSDISSYKANEMRVMELERLALLDGLTGLANRTFFLKELDAHLEELRRYEIPFGVLFIDVDHFKDFNDTYGHDIGDRVLQTISRALQTTARPFDTFCRWGGEEFVGLIRNVKSLNIVKVAERIRSLVESSHVLFGGEELRVTISIGATPVYCDDSAESLMKRADTLLYESKNTGRNKVTFG